MTAILGVEFAPLLVPWRRRMQTLAAAWFVFNAFVMPLLGSCLLFGLLITPLAPLSLMYAVWLYVDRHTPRRGGRSCEVVRSGPLTSFFHEFFPMELEKTAELDPNRNYVLGYHPHGIIAMGAFGNFALSGPFQRLFPGITPTLTTLWVNFKFPLYRDWLLAHGICEVTRESLHQLLTERGPGQAVVIVVGGAQEALDARPGAAILKLSDRKGFVKMAMTHGADLVPVFSFGENELFSQTKFDENSWMHKLQVKVKEWSSVSPVVFHGRGIFNYTFGIIPYRRKIHTIVGRPISVTQTEHPTQEQLDKLHAEYVEQLRAIFDTHKTDYGFDEHAHLAIY